MAEPAESAQSLALDALNSRRFTLAAEIYEKFISQHGPNFKTYILLADAYAKGERLQEAVEAYSTAFRLESLRPDHLRCFINALLDVMRKKKDFLPNRRAAITSAPNDYFSCYICRGILFEPVTIPCGHSFCRKCIAKDPSNTCKSCGVRHLALPFLNTNVSLQALIEKLFPHEIQSVAKKEEGNKVFAKGQLQAALELYTEALALSPNDHIIFGNRSNVFFKLKQFREAELDGENAIRLRPDWSKGYFRKAQAQAGQNKLVDAAATYLQCLLLDESREVKTHLAKVLIQLLDPISPINQEFKSRAGPSTGHSMLVQGLENLLSSRKEELQEDSPDDPDSDDGDSDDGASNWSRNGKYNILPLVPESPMVNVRDRVSKSLPMLSPPAHFCSEKSGIIKRFSTDDILKLDTSPSENDSLGIAGCLPCKILVAAAKLDPNLTLARLGRRRFSPDKLEKEDFDCSLCLRLLWEPVTTSCGHVFCRGCLDRVTDHSTKCPLCKNDLADYVNQRLATTTLVFQHLIKNYFPKEYEDRRQVHEAETADLARMGSESDAPVAIFVCTLAFPSITCPLHVFEPRYRLMVRQAMETGSRRFGMCMGVANEPGGFASIGTMLEIQDVSYFPDGRSLVNTIGGQRFKVLSRGMRDGYNTAKVEYIHDEPETEPAAHQSLSVLENRVYDIARHWFTNLQASKQQRISSHFGPFPNRVPSEIDSPQGPAWTWWEIAVLPIDQLIQLRLLGGTALRDRLLTVQSLLLHFNHAMGIGPLPAHDPRNAELNEIRLNSLQGGSQGILEFLGGNPQLPDAEPPSRDPSHP